MGTAITIDVIDPPANAADSVRAAVDWFHEVDRRFSTYRSDSEVSRLDRGEVVSVSDDMRLVLDACEDLRSSTHGYFDAYAGGRFDPSGYVKGWSVEVASARLAAAGAVSHCINAGGDIRVRGVGPSDGAWRIGITHPWERHAVAWTIAGTDLAVATSGTYERGGHVIDPFTGRAAEFLCSVSVTGPDLRLADGYATAALAMGEAGIGWLATLDGYSSAVITAAGDAYRSEGFPSL